MINHYVQLYWAKAVILIALLATGWYVYHVYSLAYAPLFISPTTTAVQSSHYAIPRKAIDDVLQTKTDKSLNVVDFSTITTTISSKTPSSFSTANDNNTSVGSEGITVNETAP